VLLEAGLGILLLQWMEEALCSSLKSKQNSLALSRLVLLMRLRQETVLPQHFCTALQEVIDFIKSNKLDALTE